MKHFLILISLLFLLIGCKIRFKAKLEKKQQIHEQRLEYCNKLSFLINTPNLAVWEEELCHAQFVTLCIKVPLPCE
jgi:hypothetical protein